MQYFRHLVPLVICLFSLNAASQAKARKSKPAPQSYATSAVAMEYAKELALAEHWPVSQVQQTLGQAMKLPMVQKLIMPATTPAAKNWQAYQARFIEPKRITAGLAFWQANEKWLAKAEADYGVAPEVVIGIIGVETFFGRITGGFRAIDALATLSFDFPSGRTDRHEFFKSELTALLRLAYRDGLDPLAIKGSYAGALGLPQFMPGSWLKYAVDHDGDGHIDLLANSADAIGSVAHYLREFGWQAGVPSRFAVQPPNNTAALATLLAPDIKPTFSAAQMTEQGAQLDTAGLAYDGPLALIQLHNGQDAGGTNQPSYVAGTSNFYVVTRYNWSSYYALAVLELGEAIGYQRAAALRTQVYSGPEANSAASEPNADLPNR